MTINFRDQHTAFLVEVEDMNAKQGGLGGLDVARLIGQVRHWMQQTEQAEARIKELEANVETRYGLSQKDERLLQLVEEHKHCKSVAELLEAKFIQAEARLARSESVRQQWAEKCDSAEQRLTEVTKELEELKAKSHD